MVALLSEMEVGILVKRKKWPWDLNIPTTTQAVKWNLCLILGSKPEFFLL
jgi:hypothetical protein